MPKGRRPLDLTGQKFNRLTALRQEGRSGKHMLWACSCDCGSGIVKHVRASELVAGAVRSCGCIVKELARENVRTKLTTHGKASSRVYRIWLGVKNRCLRKSYKQYNDYGGRGIKIVDRWMDFEAFYADMGDPPSDDHSIERRDNDGNYEPGNCYWATRTQQGANKRTSHLIEYDGRTQTITQWSRELGIPPTTISNRLRRGWPVNDAMRKL